MESRLLVRALAKLTSRHESGLSYNWLVAAVNWEVCNYIIVVLRFCDVFLSLSSFGLGGVSEGFVCGFI